MPPSNTFEAFSITHAQVLDGSTSYVAALAQMIADDAYDIYGVNSGSITADTGNYDNTGDNAILSRWNWLNNATVAVQAGYISMPVMATITGRPLTTVTITAASEVQSMSSNGASAGNFTLTFNGQTTAPIVYNAAAAVVQTALQALSTIGAGGVTVGGGPANTTALTFTFAGTLANTAQPLITATLTGLTGATGGVITRTTTGTPADTRYEMDLWHEDSMNVAPRPLLLVMPAKDKLGAVRRAVIGIHRAQFGPIGFDGPSYKEGLKVNYEATGVQSAYDELGNAFSDGKKRIGRLISVL